MYNLYNLESNLLVGLLSSFRDYLISDKISSGSVRSYVSDCRYFFVWLISYLKTQNTANFGPEKKSVSVVLSQINPKVLENYKKHLIKNYVPQKTVNRRFSSLRKLGEFCLAKSILKKNYFDTLKNINSKIPFPESKYHLAEFKTALQKNKLSKITVKNYLSDVRQFLSWNKEILPDGK